MKLSERIHRWIQKYIRVPDGKLVGKPISLVPEQLRILEGIYDTPTRQAIISFGRKNGKTALAAMLNLVHLCGPMMRPNSDLCSSALSRDQAAILFRLAAKMVRLSPELSESITIRDTAKQLLYPAGGTTYTALSADGGTNLGLSPAFVVHDELGAVRGPDSPIYDALETATGAHERPLSIVISTQAPSDGDLLSMLIDDAASGADPLNKLFLWTCPEEDEDGPVDPFSEKAIRYANPAFGIFQSKEELLRMAASAKRLPSKENSYRNLILNQRVDLHSPFVTKAVWDKNNRDPEHFTEVYGGLDLSETGDLTALVLVSDDGETLDVYCRFWLPEEGILDRSRADRVPYHIWAEQGYITLCPGAAVDYDYVAKEVADLVRDGKTIQIAFDRYNMRYFRPCLLRAGLGEATIDSVLSPFGQGFYSMSPALRETESALLNQEVRHGGNPVLQMCAANAVVKMDEAGNRKLDKRRSRGRIDGMVALAMAISTARGANPAKKVLPVEESAFLDDGIEN